MESQLLSLSNLLPELPLQSPGMKVLFIFLSSLENTNLIQEECILHVYENLIGVELVETSVFYVS